MGLLGIAMSRYSGCWVGFKVISETVEITTVVDLGQEQRQFTLPQDFELPPDGLNLRWPDPPLVQDERLQEHKGYAAIAFARANGVDRMIIDTPRARFGIVASGKAYEDVRQALAGTRDWPRGTGDHRPAVLQGPDALAAGARRHPRLLAGPRRGADRRGTAGDHREPDQAATVQLAGGCAPAHCREIRRDREAIPQPLGRADRRAGCGRNRRTPAAPRSTRGACGPPSAPGRTSACRRSARHNPHPASGAPAALLRGLPAQHLDSGARGVESHGRDRLPFHGAVDGSPDRDLHPYGRGRRAVDRDQPVHRRKAPLRQSGRRHLLPFGPPCDPPVSRGGCEHHLQDPLQRCRGDDRRAAGRRDSDPAADHPPDVSRTRGAHRADVRPARHLYRCRTRTGHPDLPPRRDRRGDAGTARGAGRDRHRLRAHLRGREAAAAQAGHDGRPGHAPLDQPGGLRRLRRLLREVELRRGRAGRDRDGPQAAHQPVDVQQGLFVPQGLLPLLRDSARRQTEETPGRGRAGGRVPARTRPARDRARLELGAGRGRRHGGADDQRDPWNGKHMSKARSRWSWIWRALRRKAARF